MALLEVNNITKRIEDRIILNDISFSQSAGQKIAIAGETGSGKSTLVKIIAGLGQADSGKVLFEEKQVLGLEEKMMPGHKGIAYLSQHFELHNKYKVSELLAYANKLTDEASANLYNVCRIEHLTDRWSHTLSGGERQRVALAKLLTELPRLLVLDEPFSNLDNIHKAQLKEVINDITGRLSTTCILVSHDAEDILPWADDVLVMKDGNIIQRGSAQEIYKYPQTVYTAGLLGTFNLLSPALASQLGFIDDRNIIRPEELYYSIENTDGIQATVKAIRYLGGYYELDVQTNDGILTLLTQDTDIAIGRLLSVHKR